MNLPRATGLALFAILLALHLAAAAAPTPSPTPAPPVPNATSLRGFAGKYTGRSNVTLGTTTNYFGSAKVRITAISDPSLKIKISAQVKAAGHSVAINNQLTFLQSGVIKGRELAPGAAKGAPFTGTYTATARRIGFQGAYKFGAATGTFTGFVTKGVHGKLNVTYSVFVTDEAGAVYTYNYTAK
ncbi:MAG: hypothetical protein PHC88_17025 [Terrimicrobiaceae bacterium]|nr:hypothetical protein [Terrimicrobiaceae bacterium]